MNQMPSKVIETLNALVQRETMEYILDNCPRNQPKDQKYNILLDLRQVEMLEDPSKCKGDI